MTIPDLIEELKLPRIPYGILRVVVRYSTPKAGIDTATFSYHFGSEFTAGVKVLVDKNLVSWVESPHRASARQVALMPTAAGRMHYEWQHSGD